MISVARDGITCAESTKLAVCHNAGISRNRVFQGLAKQGLAAKGYLSKALPERLWQRGLHLLLVTGIGRTMKNHLMPLLDKVLLRKRFHH